MPRPHRGERKYCPVRIPMSLFNNLEEAAQAAGYIEKAGRRSPKDDFGGFLVATLEQAWRAGMYPRPDGDQRQLPLSA